MQSSQTKASVPSPINFNCPILLVSMTDPVMSDIGHSYQKEALEQSVKIREIEPLTRSPLKINQIIPNPMLKMAIQDYHQLHESKLMLNEIYQQRGTEKIEGLKKTLQEIQTAIHLEQKEKEHEFKMDYEALIWPFPVICPSSYSFITDPVTASDGATYEKSMIKDSKYSLVPNRALKSVLPLFKLELNDTLSAQFKEITLLKKEIDKALEEYEKLIKKKLEPKIAAEARANKIKKIKNWAAFLAGIYGVAFLIDRFTRDIFDAQSELAPSAKRWEAVSEPLQPFVTSAHVLYRSFEDKLFSGPYLTQQHKFTYEKNQCVKYSKKDFCGRVIDFALRYRRYLLLKGFHKTIDMLYFMAAAENAVKQGDVESLEILYRLDPAILHSSPFLLIYSVKNPISDQRDQQARIKCITFLITHGYPIDQATDNLPTPLMKAIRDNDVAMVDILLKECVSLLPKNGVSPLSIAIEENKPALVTKICQKDPALAKQILIQNQILIEKVIEQEKIDLLQILIKNGADIRQSLSYAVKNGYFKAIKEILKLNTADRNTIKIILIEAHKKSGNSSIYNLLRAHLRSMDSVVVPHRNAFYQGASNQQTMISKYTQRKRGSHR